MTDKSDSDNEVFNQLLLEQSWLEASRNVLRVRPIEDYLQLAFAENANLNDSVDVIRQFTLLIEKGITPPASILSTVAKSFRNYLDIEPHDSLDTAFNLNKKTAYWTSVSLSGSPRTTWADILFNVVFAS